MLESVHYVKGRYAQRFQNVVDAGFNGCRRSKDMGCDYSCNFLNWPFINPERARVVWRKNLYELESEPPSEVLDRLDWHRFSKVWRIENCETTLEPKKLVMPYVVILNLGDR